MGLAGQGSSSSPAAGAAAPARSYSIYLRLLTIILATLAMVWMLVIGTTWYLTRHEVNELLDAHLEQTALMLAAQPLDEIDPDELEERDLRPRRGRGRGERKYHVHTVYQVWKEGTLLAQPTHAPRQPLGSGELGYSDTRTGQRAWRVYTAEGEDKVRVMVAEDAEVRNEIAIASVRTLLIALLLLFPVLALVVWLALRAAMRPLRQVGQLIAQRPPQSHAPLALDSAPREIQPLTDSLNQLFVRVGDMLHNERRFTADAAHELRTPIAAIRMMAQVASGAQDAGERQQALQGVLQGCDRATRMVEQLLQLARLEADTDDAAQRAAGAASESVDILPALRQVVQDLQYTQADPRGQTIACEAPDQLPARLPPTLAGVLLRNLLDNALRYSPDGATVRVAFTQQADGSGMRWVVEDSGPGMSEEDMARLGERFFRVLGTGKTGSGLGWSIVRRIAARHGLEITLGRSNTLGGLRVTVGSG